jgi:hypothetical protein
MPSMFRRVHPLVALAILVAAALVLAALGPREKSLGANVRLVYLHGAWVWTALVGYGAAGFAGLIGLLSRRASWQRTSLALGQAATLFWITYLPMSLAVMQANWNGLFLEEPRFRIGLNFAIVAILLQAGIRILRRPDWASALNLLFLAGLAFSLSSSREIMHPSSPIAQSGRWPLQAYFMLLTLTCLAAGWQLTRWLHRFAP